MNGEQNNPYAIYVYCDGAMDYNSKNTGGVGIEIRFPEHIDCESIELSIGRYEKANIERIELEAILQGMNEVIELYKKKRECLTNVNNIIIKTDRAGLTDQGKTNPYKIREWRKNDWKNYEGKAIKNKDLLDKIDKTRWKIANELCRIVKIEYGRRKFNKKADKLAKKGKESSLVNKSIAISGVKIGRRIYDGAEIQYQLLEEKSEYVIHVYKKEPVQDQWEICVEFCDGQFLGQSMKIYSDDNLERKLHRCHKYKVRIKKVYKFHAIIYKTVKEVKQ